MAAAIEDFFFYNCYNPKDFSPGWFGIIVIIASLVIDDLG